MNEKLRKIIGGEEFVFYELAIIGLAFLFYYLTKKSNPMEWYIIGVPLIMAGIFIALLLIIAIYRIVNYFKNKK